MLISALLWTVVPSPPTPSFGAPLADAELAVGVAALATAAPSQLVAEPVRFLQPSTDDRIDIRRTDDGALPAAPVPTVPHGLDFGALRAGPIRIDLTVSATNR